MTEFPLGEICKDAGSGKVAGNGAGHRLVSGEFMNAKLREEDRRAVDLLLDRGMAAAGKSKPVFAVNGGSQERVVGVQQVLQLLDAMPAAEPPADLVDRTLEFVESAAQNGRAPRSHRAVLPNFAAQPPVA